MKKILIAVFMMVASVFCFTACDGLGEKYWELVSTDSVTVFESDGFDSVYNISFNSNLTYIMQQPYGQDYKELTNVFEPLFESAVYYAYMHYNDFLIVPISESGEFKNQVKAVYSEIDEFASALETFNKKKTDYEASINFTTEEKATADIEKARLLKFKREYITVIESAYELSESIFEARRLGYYDFSDYAKEGELVDVMADCSLAVNATNLEITKTAIKIVRAYNAKEMASNYQSYWTASQTFFAQTVKPFENDVLNPKGEIKTKLDAWMGVYKMFKSECETLDEVIAQIDLKKLTSAGNASEYASQTGNEIDEAYANYFINFHQKVSFLSVYAMNLFV